MFMDMSAAGRDRLLTLPLLTDKKLVVLSTSVSYEWLENCSFNFVAKKGK